MENQEIPENVIIKYKVYDSQIRANKKYYQKNREAILMKKREKTHEKYESDPNYREKCKQTALKYYYDKKAKKLQKKQETDAKNEME